MLIDSNSKTLKKRLLLLMYKKIFFFNFHLLIVFLFDAGEKITKHC